MKRLLLLPGDGIGSEVIAEARRAAERLAPDLAIEERPFGGAAYDLCGDPLPAETLEAALASHAVLMGAVGGAKWATAPRAKRPEAALLGLRAAMGVFANLRPARCYGALADASSLRREVVEGLDLMIVRELTGGVYFGQPRGIETLADGSRRGLDTQVYTTGEIERVGRVAFALARGRRGKLCSVEKSNVMESGLLWRETIAALHQREFADIELEHLLADSCAMQLVRNPRRFDVIVTDNLFGDLLSDEAAELTGSMGMLPSAALGAEGKAGLFEPVHGSAPDIAGKGLANPLAALLSLAMALRLSLEAPEAAARLEGAVEKALDAGARTADIGGALSTREMAEAVLARL
ncbi:MAG: 3-isopropylmalate dehydrogenase [Caulobacteraceae bacterium]